MWECRYFFEGVISFSFFCVCDFIFFVYIPRNGIAGSNGSSIPLFLLYHLIEKFEDCVFRDITFVVTVLLVL